MKGMVFTEFLEMVDDKFSPAMTERIIEASELPNGGAYTAIGTYDYREIVRLVVELSKASGIAAPELLRVFGRHLFGRFLIGYPDFFKGVDSAFTFLEGVDRYIHVEVLKLYPDAELPRFECDRPEPGQLRMVYRSMRCMGTLAEGLILGCIDHFGEKITIHTEDLSEGRGNCIRFTLAKQAA